MKTLSLTVALLTMLAGLAGQAAADPWKDESGHGRWIGRHDDDDRHWRPRRQKREHRYERRAYKEEYREGGCKIEREWSEDEYKEEIKCERGRRPSAYYDLY